LWHCSSTEASARVFQLFFIGLPVNWIKAALQRLDKESAVRVTVSATQGSVPRGTGTPMLVFAQGEAGTIGGGHLEFQALAHARRSASAGLRLRSSVLLMTSSLIACRRGMRCASTIYVTLFLMTLT
jgi:xanthine/CO dehydrogenase XdhC/CoxF family maturation factor